MALTRLQNIISSVEGRILYVNPDDFDATDAIDNKGNSPIRPFKTIARAVLEVARYSYVSAGNADDKFDQFTILLYPGDHIVDNRPGTEAYGITAGNYVAGVGTFTDTPTPGNYAWNAATKQYDDLYKITNAPRGGLIIPRGTSIIGLDLRKTKVRPKYIPSGGTNTAADSVTLNYTADPNNLTQLTIDQVAVDGTTTDINDLIIESSFEKGVLGPKYFTPTNAIYTPSSGILKLTLPAGHGLTTNDYLKINTNSLTFECAMDGGSQQKTYPRPTDPYANTQIPIENFSGAGNNDIEVYVGETPNVQHNVSGGTYDATTGYMQLTIGAGHGIAANDTVKIADNSLTFTCDMDDYATPNRTYPRTDTFSLNPAGVTTTAAYVPQTGIVTVTINKHGMDNGDLIKIADNTFTFECDLQQGAGLVQKQYPRNTDPISGHWIPVSNVTENTFDIQCLHETPSTNTAPHGFVSAVVDGITKKLDRAYDSPVEVVAADSVNGTITLNVGKAPTVNFDVTNANFDVTTGLMELTIGDHSLAVGTHIKLAPNSLTFNCGAGSGTYPRASGAGTASGRDYAYETSLAITAASATTITIDVNNGLGALSGTTDVHSWGGTTASNAVITGGNYNHTWNGGIATNAITSGGDYAHTFIGAADDSVVVETGVVVIEPGTRISSVDTALGSSTIKVNLSKPHAYTTANGYTTNTSEIGKIVKVPYEDDNSRTALFRITGGCYFWQFTILDGDINGIYNTSTVEPQSTWPSLVSPIRSHTKITMFEFASQHDLYHFYRKVADSITLVNAEKIEPKIQENRIVGALGDQVNIVSVSRNSNIVTVTLEEELNLTANNYVVIAGTVAGGGANGYYTGEKSVSSVITKTQFTFTLTTNDESQLNGIEADQDNSTPYHQVTYTPSGCTAQVEIDTVESASPYIFNCSLRSTYGACGMHADGSRASGFKSMVVAQYTGISLQKDDGAFLKYSTGSGIYSNDGATAYHTDINAVYNPLQRSYHVKASNRAVIQAVSVFAVGYADHFIAEDGGDMSVTNSNSNFGSNAMRSIGFSDRAFNKDALGKITHIIPPRNIESTDTNVYWESIDTQTTTAGRIYLTGRTDAVTVTSGGSKFNGASLVTSASGVNLTLTVTAGVITAVTQWTGLDGTNLQPGDTITIDSPNVNEGGLPCVLTVGGSLTINAGKYKVGGRTKDKDGSTVKDKIYVPLYVSGSTTTSEQSAEIDTAGSNVGNIFDYDMSGNQWYVNVATGTNAIFLTIDGNNAVGEKYHSSGILSTPNSYLKRIVDERVDNDKIYRLRYVTKRDQSNNILPSYPQTGYILQVKKGGGISGQGDRFTDGANLLLLNKRFLAWETVARYKADNPSYTVPDQGTAGGDWNCQDDIISVIDAIAFNLRYGGNSEVYDAANLYINLPGGQYLGDAPTIITMFNDYLKPLMQSVLYNTAVTGAILNRDPNNTSTIFFNQETISNPANLAYAQGTCANVRNSSYTLLKIITDTLGTVGTANPALPAGTVRNTPSATYTRRSGFQYDEVYYIYDVEEVTPYAWDGVNETPGVYYLTVLKGSVAVDSAVLPGSTFKFSQNTNTLVPKIDIDSPVSDPIIARSSADPVLIGSVKTSTGLSASTADAADPSYSITKESLSSFFDEYFNNELEWTWTGPTTVNSQLSHTINLNNYDGTHGATVVNLQSGDGSGEIRKINLNPTRSGDEFEIELRRPSTIRSGNHTFEYVGFGPGNYSTAFPIKQTKILSPDEQKYAQSLKEQGGIAFYSGLNSNGDLYIGNTVINAVTGKTTENQITELKELTITDNLNVIGGSGNILNTNFQGPVTFLKSITGEGENIFSSISLRNSDGIISKIINNDTAPASGDGDKGDFQFNSDPIEGGHFGWSKNSEGEWKTTGLTELDKIHSYKDTWNTADKYCLNIGSDVVDLSTDLTVNTHYSLDVTDNQRIGEYLDIGSTAVKTLAPISQTATKATRLSIYQTWDDNTVVYKPIEVIVTPTLSGAAGTKLIDLINGSDSVFNVDKDGNVAIPQGSTYGLSNSAFYLKLTVKGQDLVASNEIAFTGAGGPFTSSTVYDYDGTSKSASGTSLTWGFKTSDVNSFTTKGSNTGGGMYFDDFNARSILLFINGVMQEPFGDYDFDGTSIYMNSAPSNDSIIIIRGLAN